MFLHQQRTKKKNVWTTVAFLNVVGLGLGSIVGFSYLVLPQLSTFAHAQDHETSLPWIASEKECQGESRVWIDGACWDEKHDASF